MRSVPAKTYADEYYSIIIDKLLGVTDSYIEKGLKSPYEIALIGNCGGILETKKTHLPTLAKSRSESGGIEYTVSKRSQEAYRLLKGRSSDLFANYLAFMLTLTRMYNQTYWTKKAIEFNMREQLATFNMKEIFKYTPTWLVTEKINRFLFKVADIFKGEEVLASSMKFGVLDLESLHRQVGIKTMLEFIESPLLREPPSRYKYSNIIDLGMLHYKEAYLDCMQAPSERYLKLRETSIQNGFTPGMGLQLTPKLTKQVIEIAFEILNKGKKGKK